MIPGLTNWNVQIRNAGVLWSSFEINWSDTTGATGTLYNQKICDNISIKLVYCNQKVISER